MAYAIDHDEFETWILRVLRAIGERDRREWASIVRELRKHKLTHLVEDEPLDGRRISEWYHDMGLEMALLEFTKLKAKNTFHGAMGRMQFWLSELPLRIPPSEAERPESELFNRVVLDRDRPVPPHLTFLKDSDAKCNYLLPEEVAQLGPLLGSSGYLARAGRAHAVELGEPYTADFIERLVIFLRSAVNNGHALYFYEMHT